MIRTVFAFLILITWCSAALAQPVTVIGTITPGDCAIFNSTTIIKDSQFACPPSGPALVIGTTTITGGTSNGILFDNGGLLGNTPSVANAILSTSPTAVPGLNNIITGQNYLSAMTNTGEAFGYSFRNSTVTGNSIYSAIFPGVSAQDGVQSVINVPPGGTVTQATGFASYFQNGGTTNTVGLFAAGTGTVANAPIWGVNTLLQDNATRATHARTGQFLIGSELDFNVMGNATQVIGVSIGGNSLASPSVANGFIVNSLGGSAKWGTGFWCVGGTISGQCLAVGPSAGAGASVPSQNVLFQYYNVGSVQKNFTLDANNGVFNVFNNDTTSTINVGFSASSEGFLSLAGSTGGASLLGVQPTASGLVRLPNFTGTLPSTVPSPLIKDATTGAVTWTGLNSGGLLYASSATSVASSAALAANGIVTGGGPGVAPSTAGGCSVDPTSSSLSCSSSVAFSPGFILKNTTNDNSYVGHNLFKQRNTSIVQNGDGLGGYGFYGYDGATFQVGGQILAQVDGVPGAGSMPGRIVFNTTPLGSVTLAEVFRIDNSQHVQFAAPSIAANGGVATAMTSLGPTGSHTTIQEWLVVKNASGVVRWIPMF